MVEKPFGPLPKNWGGDIHRWTRDMTEQGARGLGVEKETSSAPPSGAPMKGLSLLPAVYIRKTFQVQKSEGEEE